MIRKLEVNDVIEFCSLIVDMYSNLENLEWFSPMPFDKENVTSMIENPRFYIIGYFQDNKLVGVGSLDYKCGKLIGKVDFEKYCDTSKLVELGFHIVHSNYRGNGIMKKMVAHLIEKSRNDGYIWGFGKVHKDNYASFLSLRKLGFENILDYAKPVKKDEFISLSSEGFFSNIGKENAKVTLKKNENKEHIIVDYNIWLKKL